MSRSILSCSITLRRHSARAASAANQGDERMDAPPDAYVCPISLCVMGDPVLVVQSGITYERKYIEEALRRDPSRDPKTNQEWATPLTLAPNVAIRSAIREWQDEHDPNRVVELAAGRRASAGGASDGWVAAGGPTFNSSRDLYGACA